MSEQRALRMCLEDSSCLGRLRRRSGVEVCQHQDAIWVRVREISDELEVELRKLPGTRFSVLPDGQLVRFGKLVPSGHLPDDRWVRLARWMTVQADPPALSGEVSDGIGLRIVRGGQSGESNVIVTSLERWQKYAVGAPQVRLDRWAFAINGEGKIVVRGEPLPPVQGGRFVERSGVAVEAGWTWSPRIAPDVLSEALGLASGDVALLYEDGTWDHVQAADFVRATRSAVRLSCEAFSDG